MKNPLASFAQLYILQISKETNQYTKACELVRALALASKRSAEFVASVSPLAFGDLTSGFRGLDLSALGFLPLVLKNPLKFSAPLAGLLTRSLLGHCAAAY